MREFVKNISDEIFITSSMMAKKYKTDQRTAALAMDRFVCEGLLNRRVDMLEVFPGQKKLMWVYWKA